MDSIELITNIVKWGTLILAICVQKKQNPSPDTLWQNHESGINEVKKMDIYLILVGMVFTA